MSRIDLAGRQWGRWVVVGRAPGPNNTGVTVRRWILRCTACGAQHIRLSTNFAASKTPARCVVCDPVKTKRELSRRSRLAYGMSLEQAADLRAWWGACDICGRPVAAVDHCHETNQIRGCLCTWCNIAISYLEKLTSRGLLADAFNYLLFRGVSDQRALLLGYLDRTRAEELTLMEMEP